MRLSLPRVAFRPPAEMSFYAATIPRLHRHSQTTAGRGGEGGKKGRGALTTILRILSTIDETDYRNHIAQRDKGGHRLHVLAARSPA